MHIDSPPTSEQILYLKQRYWNHRSGAKYAGDQYDLLFADWLKLWFESKKINLMGKHLSDFAMVRRDPWFAWRLGNVEIVTVGEQRKRAHAVREARKALKAGIPPDHPPPPDPPRKLNPKAPSKPKADPEPEPAKPERPNPPLLPKDTIQVITPAGKKLKFASVEIAAKYLPVSPDMLKHTLEGKAKETNGYKAMFYKPNLLFELQVSDRYFKKGR